MVSNTDLLSDSARVSAVFVDGIRYEVAPPPAARAAGGAGGGGGAAQVAGTWNMTLQSPQGPLDVTMTLTQTGAAFSGTMTSQVGSMEVVDGQVAGRNATWTATLTMGGQTINLSYRAEVEGNRMTGSAELGSFGSATFTAERKP